MGNTADSGSDNLSFRCAISADAVDDEEIDEVRDEL
jgi:hypothetical protein